MAVRFGVLGVIEAWRDGRALDVGHARQRWVLAALLADAGQVVRADALVERVWGERMPRRGREALYGYVSRLRRALPAPEVDIVREQGGYRLSVHGGSTDTGTIDLRRFRELTHRARATDPGERAAVLWEEALGLWRGDAFAGADTPWFNAQRSLLDAERLAARLDLAETRLRLGQHAGMAAELAARAERHPLDERVAGQLMLALYRCGRQAEALERYERIRRLLAEEMGVDPGGPLRRLYHRILTADPALAVSPSQPAEVPAVRRPRPVPRQLPPPPVAFTGRGRELAALEGLLKRSVGADRGPVISAVGGAGGVGKTWLALHWAHENLDLFPDGQLYVNLRGFDPSADPLTAPAAVRGFLDALGTDPQQMPADPESQAGLYRSLVAGRRMLIVLDNARDTDQVRPLLPGGGNCVVVVTSRSHLGGLTATHGSQYLALGTLPDDDARQVFSHALGHDRMAAEPGAVAVLLRRCAGLPLALGITAARAAARPDFPLAALADELDDAPTRLDALHAGDLATDLRGVFETSLRALDTQSARFFPLLGLAPGPDIGAAAAARLADLPLPATRRVLRVLEAAHLVGQHCPGRYRMHDLVRLHAIERGREQPADVRDAALGRLVDFYLCGARAGDRFLAPHRTPLAPPEPDPAPVAADVRDAGTAMTWFEAEHVCLLAAHRSALTHGWHGRAWQLAWALDTFHWRRGLLSDRVGTLRDTLPALASPPDRAALALAHRLLGRAHVPLGEHDRAVEHLERALALFEEAGEAAGRAQTHLNFALAWEQRGDDAQALEHAVRNLRLRETLDSPPREAEALNAVGWYHARLGDHRQAREYCERALALCRRHGFREGEAFTLDSLGYIAHQGGRYPLALEHYGRALTLRRELGDHYEEADTLARLGDAYGALDRPAEARRAWSGALALYRDQRRTAEAEGVHERLAALGPAGG
ncbi:tetratricopeptide repeat protein [Streptomyces sp. NBC_01498]|uniref:AfsR/SARP family transcriptional regulator n=1 Tax=Streptomyces sp. NBC_01498 TaxID=2975870 RepID=UPI002E7B1DDA|nr:BTAD domain-containing putative transcriptional regulator [Streptomyces sp. NBC_01498]WTL28353.1 tetratricopeptide repeat protein [Streptomyces sp. NBC_01498]